MREVGAFEAKTHFSALLDEAARGRRVARLTAHEEQDKEAAVTGAATLRRLRKRIGWATTEDILKMRDARGRQLICAPLDITFMARHINSSLTCQA